VATVVEGLSSTPLFTENKLKLGLFGANLRRGLTITTAENSYDTRWDLTEKLVRQADGMGLELIIPVGRWKGFGGPSDFHGSSYETFTWAAGLASITERSMVVATCHVPVFHPLVAAKMSTTVDHISNGRFGLNIVAGWNRPELEMFGAEFGAHETRYAKAQEWTEAVRRLWTADEEFDLDGDFYTLKAAWSRPKPIQQPHPAILFAGGSPTGRRFAAQYADIAFVVWDDLETAKGYIDELRRIAREEFNREILVFAYSLVVCRPTEKEARQYYDYCVFEKGDWEGGQTYADIVGMNTKLWDNPEKMKEKIIAGLAGYQMIGTPDMMVEQLGELTDAGYDGTVLVWVDYEAGLDQWEADVMPLLTQAGLRS
jgi:FMNH2-dependent dimethyl sulfone monooxygenase